MPTARLGQNMKCCHCFLSFKSYVGIFVQDSLCVLNISHNNVDDIGDLRVLRKLHHFSAADNKLHHIAVNTALKKKNE